MKELTMSALLYLLIILFASCKKDIMKSTKAGTEYFPNSIGNYWNYEVFDSSNIRTHPNAPRNYNVTVNVIGTKILVDNKPAMVWKYEYPWGIELKYYRVSADTLKTYDTIYSRTITDLLYPRELFIIPFSNGQSWSGKLLWTDSFHVQQKLIPNFENVFWIHRDYVGQQVYYQNDYGFAPKIGFVRFYRNEINQGIQTRELWQLKYYNLK